MLVTILTYYSMILASPPEGKVGKFADKFQFQNVKQIDISRGHFGSALGLAYVFNVDIYRQPLLWPAKCRRAASLGAPDTLLICDRQP